MSKKRKRKTQTETEKNQSSSSVSKSSPRNRPDAFDPDYSYVKKDLRTIGILAGIFITILVVLSFII
jgi:hypothetical protein